MADNRTAWIAVINGKTDPFYFCRGTHKLKRKIAKYCHLNMEQFYAIGNYVRKATKKEIAANESN